VLNFQRPSSFEVSLSDTGTIQARICAFDALHLSHFERASKLLTKTKQKHTNTQVKSSMHNLIDTFMKNNKSALKLNIISCIKG